jgi:hypothetical protein
MRFGRPAIGGVSTEHIAGMVMAEGDVATVVEEYDLERHGGRHAVLLACWWEGSEGVYRRQWKTWAAEVAPWLGGHRKPLDVDALPDPPTRDELGWSGKRKRVKPGPA